jgi:hypothetical protein
MEKFFFVVLFLGTAVLLTACSETGGCGTCVPDGSKRSEICFDGIDNDHDGIIDCADPDCARSADCRTEICSNGIDDDQDGFIDCNDSECVGVAGCTGAAVERLCEDGLDNDGDGFVDCLDPNCFTHEACLGEVETDCEDGIDNDGDGLIDCADPRCRLLPICQSADGESNCADGIDNDFDGDTDCDDSDCEDHSACQPEVVPSVLSFRINSPYRAGYCRNETLGWRSGAECTGQVLLFTAIEGNTYFPNYTGSRCTATSLRTGEDVFSLRCVAGTDGLNCEAVCFAICGPERFANGTSQVTFICLLDSSDPDLRALAVDLSGDALADELYYTASPFEEF